MTHSQHSNSSACGVALYVEEELQHMMRDECFSIKIHRGGERLFLDQFLDLMTSLYINKIAKNTSTKFCWSYFILKKVMFVIFKPTSIPEIK